MLIKIVIVALLFFIVFSLGRAMFSLVRSDGDSDRTIRALTWRISLSILLFILLMISYKFGWIQPHGVINQG